MVEANIIEASDRQHRTYDNYEDKTLIVGQHVLLSNPTRGKLDPRWTGPWTITGLKGPTTTTIQMGKAVRTIPNPISQLWSTSFCTWGGE